MRKSMIYEQKANFGFDLDLLRFQVLETTNLNSILVFINFNLFFCVRFLHILFEFGYPFKLF